MKAEVKKLIADIQKEHGVGAIAQLGKKPALALDVISTGIPALDIALGVGGLVRGQPVELFGPESSGKTTIALHIVAEAQKLGGVCAYIDVEHALDPTYAKAIGVQVDELLLSQPDSAEEGLDIAVRLATSKLISVIVVDSIAALVPRAEIEGDVGDSHVGLQPRLMGQALRKLKPVLSKSNTICLFINQLRMKIGNPYGNPETTPGGRAMAYAAGVRMDIRRKDAIKTGTVQSGNQTRIRIVKNKWAPPFTTAEFDIIYGQGVSKSSSLIDIALDAGVIERKGAHYYYGGAKLGQGRDAVRTTLEDHPALFDEIAAKVAAA